MYLAGREVCPLDPNSNAHTPITTESLLFLFWGFYSGNNVGPMGKHGLTHPYAQLAPANIIWMTPSLLDKLMPYSTIILPEDNIMLKSSPFQTYRIIETNSSPLLYYWLLRFLPVKDQGSGVLSAVLPSWKKGLPAPGPSRTLGSDKMQQTDEVTVKQASCPLLIKGLGSLSAWLL